VGPSFRVVPTNGTLVVTMEIVTAATRREGRTARGIRGLSTSSVRLLMRRLPSCRLMRVAGDADRRTRGDPGDRFGNPADSGSPVILRPVLADGLPFRRCDQLHTDPARDYRGGTCDARGWPGSRGLGFHRCRFPQRLGRELSCSAGSGGRSRSRCTLSSRLIGGTVRISARGLASWCNRGSSLGGLRIRRADRCHLGERCPAGRWWATSPDADQASQIAAGSPTSCRLQPSRTIRGSMVIRTIRQAEAVVRPAATRPKRCLALWHRPARVTEVMDLRSYSLFRGHFLRGIRG
jgi:hypothetical protein